MKCELSQHQIEEYRENGFITIDAFLSQDELSYWREAVDEAVLRRGDNALPERPDVEDEAQAKNANAEESGHQDVNAVYYGNVFIQRLNLWQDNVKMRNVMIDARIGKMAAELEGVDGIRIWHDQALIKAPWANPTAWHLDNPYWSFSSRNSISIWVALDDATRDNGCLYFIPGTHKLSRYDNSGIGMNMGELFKVYPEFARMKSVAAPMKAGSCSFHNGLAAHGAGANMTPGFRRAMTCAYMPDGSTFNGTKNILSREQFAKLKMGDVLDDDRQNPLIYSHSKPYVTLST